MSSCSGGAVDSVRGAPSPEPAQYIFAYDPQGPCYSTAVSAKAVPEPASCPKGYTEVGKGETTARCPNGQCVCTNWMDCAQQQHVKWGCNGSATPWLPFKVRRCAVQGTSTLPASRPSQLSCRRLAPGQAAALPNTSPVCRTASKNSADRAAHPTAVRDVDGDDPLLIINSVALDCLVPWTRADPCSFYRDCLDDALSCESSNHPYALSYGEKFCKAFSALSSQLSPVAQQWVRDTMACLQESLILWHGEIAPNGAFYVINSLGENAQTVANCESIRAVEFQSHAGCYLGDASRIRNVTHASICNLDVADLLHILDLAKGDVWNYDGLSQMFTVGERCVITWTIPEGPARDDDAKAHLEFWQSWVQWARTGTAGSAGSSGSGSSPPPCGLNQQACCSGKCNSVSLSCVNNKCVVPVPTCGLVGQGCCGGICTSSAGHPSTVCAADRPGLGDEVSWSCQDQVKCNPVTQPSPDWGVYRQTNQCMKSCSALGGDVCNQAPNTQCPGRSSFVGFSYDCPQCCKACVRQCPAGSCGGADGCGGTCPNACPAKQKCNASTNRCYVFSPGSVCGQRCRTEQTACLRSAGSPGGPTRAECGEQYSNCLAACAN